MITSKKHNKHTKLVRPETGIFSRCEVGILGATCDRIKTLVEVISARLSTNANIYYLDADHSERKESQFNTLTDGINHHRLTYDSILSIYDQKSLLAKADITLVNVNHFEAKCQIVCCTLKKKESLAKKLHRLTEVKLILLDDDVDQPFDFLAPIIAEHSPIVASITDIEKIANLIGEIYNSSLPKIKGLIMAGGRSQRMGEDKSHISYHNTPQWQHLAQMTSALDLETYISCREDQKDQFDEYQTITDTFLDLGPYGALLSAFRNDPNAAWLTIACDLPLLKSKHIKALIDQVSYRSHATSYHNPTTGWPEPMVTIWMPKSYPELLKYLALGYSCPRKVLINTPVHQLHVDDASFLHNANTPADRIKAKEMLD